MPIITKALPEGDWICCLCDGQMTARCKQIPVATTLDDFEKSMSNDWWRGAAGNEPCCATCASEVRREQENRTPPSEPLPRASVWRKRNRIPSFVPGELA